MWLSRCRYQIVGIWVRKIPHPLLQGKWWWGWLLGNNSRSVSKKSVRQTCLKASDLPSAQQETECCLWKTGPEIISYLSPAAKPGKMWLCFKVVFGDNCVGKSKDTTLCDSKWTTLDNLWKVLFSEPGQTQTLQWRQTQWWHQWWCTLDVSKAIEHFGLTCLWKRMFLSDLTHRSFALDVWVCAPCLFHMLLPHQWKLHTGTWAIHVVMRCITEIRALD